MSNPFIIFVGHSANDMHPFESAPNQAAAVNRAIELCFYFPCVEAVFMPEDNLEINEVVFAHR